jgi:hypothetical protein
VLVRSYAEFAKILNVEDIVSIKTAGAEEEGLVRKAAPIEWKNGVSKEEIRDAQQKLKEFATWDLKRFKTMFRAMDEDKSGWVDRSELRTLPNKCNLGAMIREAVMDELVSLMDYDGDGRILYKEFVRLVMAEDVFVEAGV